MNISSATFLSSAPDFGSCPDESMPEFALIGRSNVGKSSLLNLLSGQRDLARVSATPGSTKLINFFLMNRCWRLVDLPGYGYAKVAREDRAQFNEAVLDYLKHRSSLCCVFALLDSTLPPQPIDLEFVGWLTRNQVPYVLVFTKTDAAKPAQVEANIEAFRERISGWFQRLPEIYRCSAAGRSGRRELLDVVGKALAEHGVEEPPPEVSPASAPDQRKELFEDVQPPGFPVRATSERAASDKPAKRSKGARPW